MGQDKHKREALKVIFIVIFFRNVGQQMVLKTAQIFFLELICNLRSWMKHLSTQAMISLQGMVNNGLVLSLILMKYQFYQYEF